LSAENLSAEKITDALTVSIVFIADPCATTW
jgi:hypothetical protein